MTEPIHHSLHHFPEYNGAVTAEVKDAPPPRHFPGLQIFHDVRNERYLHPAMAAAVPGAQVELPPLRTVKHQQYRRYDQGANPSCTGYSLVTYLATAHPFNPPPLSGADWYAFNRQEDQQQGRFYSEGGATTVASMQVGVRLGLFSRYEWLYTLESMQRAVQTTPLVFASDWYPWMWERDAEGIVRNQPQKRTSAGGHQYELNAWDMRRGLWRYPSTWGDGDYLLEESLVYDLLRDGGECSVPQEIQLPKGYHLPEAVPDLK